MLLLHAQKKKKKNSALRKDSIKIVSRDFLSCKASNNYMLLVYKVKECTSPCTSSPHSVAVAFRCWGNTNTKEQVTKRISLPKVLHPMTWSRSWHAWLPTQHTAQSARQEILLAALPIPTHHRRGTSSLWSHVTVSRAIGHATLVGAVYTSKVLAWLPWGLGTRRNCNFTSPEHANDT